MQRLDHRLIILQFVHGYVAHGKYESCVITHMHVDFGSWELNLLERLLHFWLPLFHQCIEVGHIFGVVDSGRWTRLV